VDVILSSPHLTTTSTPHPTAAPETDGSVVGASPLGSARYTVSQSLSEVDATVAHLAGRIEQSEVELGHIRERVEHATALCKGVLAHLHRMEPADVEEAVARLADARAALGAVEERLRELQVQRQAAVGRAASLRQVLTSLDELAVADRSDAAAGAARFRSASRQVFQIIEEERMRIARDMHDGPAQALSNLVLQAEVLERLVERDPATLLGELEDFKQGVRAALEDTRRLIFDLRPMTLDDLGLVATVRRLVREFGERTAIAPRFHLVGEERRLPGGCEAVVFRIVQEALANVRKHAHAGSVEVVLTYSATRVTAVIRDDGEGFDVPATEARQGRTRHLGLISMRERADLEKGAFEVRSQLGRGTEVRVSFTV
jgi:two-component system sensor histidine kinase DegS